MRSKFEICWICNAPREQIDEKSGFGLGATDEFEKSGCHYGGILSSEADLRAIAWFERGPEK